MIKTPRLLPLFLSVETFPTFLIMDRVFRPFYTYQTCLYFLCDNYVCIAHLVLSQREEFDSLAMACEAIDLH